jgi:hypothetical protein
LGWLAKECFGLVGQGMLWVGWPRNALGWLAKECFGLAGQGIIHPFLAEKIFISSSKHPGNL